ncbi:MULTISPECIES: TonB-dependent receptor [unclassified Sphingobium]|uniref:TonB-dependent receptor n=1 Tax=unclassified Sphingobium TaxID=2611147 RepID=UPI00343927F5
MRAVKPAFHYTVSAACIAIAMAGSSTIAQAQSGNQASNLEDIIVTARRVEENQQKIPVAVTTLTAASMERRNVVAVNDLQFSVPNLQIKPSNNNPSLPEFIIRGQRQVLYTDENVVTYVNGVAQSTRGLSLYDLENVQALKGPQGTLFGKNSMGGAMVFTTARPKFDPEARFDLEMGNYNRVQGTVMGNIPLIDEVAALRIAGRIERQDGFFKNLRPGGKDLNDRNNESFRVSLLVKPGDRFENLTTFDYIHKDEIPTPSLIEAAPLANNFFRSVTQQAVTQQSALGGSTPLVDTANGLLVRQGNPFRSVAFTGIGKTLTNARYPALTGFGARSEVYGIANTTSFELSDAVTLKNIIGARYEEALDFQDPSGITGMTFDFGTLFGAPPGFVTGQATNNDTYYRNQYKTFSDEFQVIGRWGNLNLITGLYYAHVKHQYNVNSSFVVGPASFYGPAFEKHGAMRDSTESMAAFAQGTYDFSGVGLDGLRLTLGARYTRDKKEMRGEGFYSTSTETVQSWNPAFPQGQCNELNGTFGNAVGVNNGAECSLTNHRTYKAVTWTGSLEYQATPDTLLYFASRRGFKAGGPNPTTRVLEFSMFGPEKITDFELGLKHQGRLGSVPYRLNIAGFIGKYRDIQTSDILQFCTNDNVGCSGGGVFTELILLNVGKATIKGIEVEGSIKPVPQLELNAGYSYQVGRYGSGSIVPQPTDPANPVNAANPINFAGGVDLSGKEFAGVPRQTLTLSGTYEADFIPESFAKTRLSVNYFYRTKTKGLAVQGNFGTPAFDTLGARLSFDQLFESNFSLALWGSNITNNYYKLYCSNNLNSIGYAACKWGDPRTYGATLSVKF